MLLIYASGRARLHSSAGGRNFLAFCSLFNDRGKYFITVDVYRLCLHCNNGKREIQLVGRYYNYSTTDENELYIPYGKSNI
ncbi:hypothetical protein E2C01_032484 [Portunus trituberculatus]|uniref:Uncharacterized protein n=1 Tax=Portunus trituberculatus TaxID=210409 RepID=A0A5B7EZR3_PORTR|nr:hypothetical protein [Portunus trituberculatus]